MNTTTHTARILVIEDNPTDVILLQEALREHHVQYELRVLEDGEAAIDLLTGLDPKSAPELVILDLNLPKRDGIEVLARYRNTPELTGIPVVVLTTSDSPREQHRAQTLGVAAYLRKPSDLAGFMSLGGTIRELLAGVQ